MYKNPIQIPNIGVDDDQSSLESSGSLRKSCSVLTANGNFQYSASFCLSIWIMLGSIAHILLDLLILFVFLLDLMPIETARAKFLQIVVDNFIGDHIIEKGVACIENGVESVDDKSNKRKSTEYHYEGDPRFVLPLMYVANLYETLVGEVNMRLSPLNGLREKTIGVALEASGGLYRKLTQKFPKTGSIS